MSAIYFNKKKNAIAAGKATVKFGCAVQVFMYLGLLRQRLK